MRASRYTFLTPARAGLLALTLLFCSQLTAQLSFTTGDALQDSIDASAQALILLDSKARDCLSALDSDADSQPACDDFLAAVDGELVADYLRQCTAVRKWREEYVTQRSAAPSDADAGNSVQMLERLIAIEYNCSENSLVERTEFVAVTFDRLRSVAAPAGGDSASSAAFNLRLAERNFNALNESERRRLQDALQRERLRNERQIERQFDELQLELLRQQIRSANRPPN